MKKNLFLGIDVGGTKIAAGIVDANGKIIAREKCPTPSGHAKEVLSCLFKLIKKILRENNKARGICGIGIGIPGIVDGQNGKILITPNIPLSGYSIAKILKSRFNLPVAAGNDVNLGVLGEKWMGSGKGAKNIVGIFPGTGVGGGIIINEKIYDWQAGAAELGHMIIEIDGPKCSCGNKGCLEAIVGRWAIERDIRKAVKKGKKTIIEKLAGKKLSMIKSKLLKKALKKKDPLVTGIMKRVAKALGVACINLRHILNPDVIILGGGVMEACGFFLLPKIKKFVEADKFFNKAKIRRLKIAESKLGDDAIIIGAACLIKQKLKK
ncbi:MAG: ROK family protein [Candidatus Omnitrophica bacterium]|nr:ROK family protein [Candidatus Omnitrophota bacterium]